MNIYKKMWEELKEIDLDSKTSEDIRYGLMRAIEEKWLPEYKKNKTEYDYIKRHYHKSNGEEYEYHIDEQTGFETIERKFFEKYGFIGTCFVEQRVDKKYAIVRECDNVPIVFADRPLDSLKDDILTVQYTGELHATGDFILKSDNRGIICNFE